MLRIRTSTGQLQEIDQSYRFVEICDLDGKVAKVFYLDNMGTLHEIDGSSAEAARYSKVFKSVEFTKVTT